MLTLPDDLSSPGRAFGSRAVWETTIDDLMVHHTGNYLRAMAETISHDKEVMASVLEQAYTDLVVRPTLAQIDTPYPEAYAEIAASLTEDDLPEEVYETSRLVLSKHGSRADLFEALDINTPSLTASIFNTGGLRARGASWLNRTKSRARTTATRTHAKMTILQLKATLGYTHKRWVTRRDDRVRESHAAVDGQAVPINGTFQVGSTHLKYPGESVGVPGETYSCRCIILGAERTTS